MVQEIERKVISLTTATKENIERETGISSSLDDEDMREYLDKVVQEIKRVRHKGNNQ